MTDEEKRTTKGHLATAVVIGIVAGWFCVDYRLRLYGGGAADLAWSLHAGRLLLSGINPYTVPLPAGYVSYPLFSVLAVLPLLALADTVAAGVFFGCSSAVLAWALLRRSSYWGLLVLLAFPYWAALQTVQWSPLLAALWLLPAGLLPLALVKPQLALPVLLTRLSWRLVFACGVVGLLSLVILPSWPWLWLGQLGGYDDYGGFVPIVSLWPLVLVLLPALGRGETRAWFLLILLCMPQRLNYDQLLLYLIPAAPAQFVSLVAAGWLSAMGGWSVIGQYGAAVGIVAKDDLLRWGRSCMEYATCGVTVCRCWLLPSR